MSGKEQQNMAPNDFDVQSGANFIPVDQRNDEPYLRSGENIIPVRGYAVAPSEPLLVRSMGQLYFA